MQKVYVFIENLGDGSGTARYTQDPALLNKLIDADPESFGQNEGYADVLSFPDELDLVEAGFSFHSGEVESLEDELDLDDLEE